MTWEVPRRIFSAVDIATDHTVEITPANDEAEGDSAFVDSFNVVTRPRDRIGNARIYTQGT